MSTPSDNKDNTDNKDKQHIKKKVNIKQNNIPLSDIPIIPVIPDIPVNNANDTTEITPLATDKKDKKDKKDITSSSSSSKKNGCGGGSVVGRVGVYSLGADDFFSKADEFRVWLKVVRGTPFETLTSSTGARQIFETEFCKAYNDNRLADMFYVGIPLEIRSQINSEHNWAIKITSKDEDTLQKVADDIDRQTRANKW